MAWIPLSPPAAIAAAPQNTIHAPAVLKYWHLASLDAPTVAVVWACGFAWAAHVRLPLWAPLLLALLVWTFYVFDRLLDAQAGFRAGRLHPLRERHYFHWRHRRTLAALAAAASVAAAWAVCQRLPASAFRPGSLVAAATAVYFSGVHSPRFRPPRLPRTVARLISREVVVAVIFAAGCAVPVMAMARPAAQIALPWRVLLCPVPGFAALAWLNLRAIAIWESAPTGRHRPTVVHPAMAMVSASLLGTILLSAHEPRAAALLACAAASALLLAWLHLGRDRMAPVTLRAAADLALLTPLLLIPVPWLLK